ncbi:astacin-like metalloprotease toxin 5 [Diabrotica virgifera virgifera]|uniref:Metalloendopeptidase n=1 Tax=Diabrotica virgifera virgifera TaxID=50390 RepID=A0ABM5JZ43_DIAVI|nr:astacin-like metalloprotease toxin 5 [Diabrotica virgifera virgifera]
MQRLLLFAVILYVTDVNTLQRKNFKVGQCTLQGERKYSPESSLCSSSTKLRNALTDPARLWDNGRVPYVFNGTFTDRERRIMKKVMDLYKYYTCIEFVPKTENDRFYVRIINEVDKCCSEVGKVISGSPNIVELGPSCFQEEAGAIIHEFMHLIGFHHEHSRSDRNRYIKLIPANMDPEFSKEFERKFGDTFNLPYDYDSVMHYGTYHGAIHYPLESFSVNDASVMKSRLGQICGFSKLDITKINILYKCPQKTAQLNLQDDLLYGVDISTAGEVKYFIENCLTC